MENDNDTGKEINEMAEMEKMLNLMRSPNATPKDIADAWEIALRVDRYLEKKKPSNKK